MSKNIREKFFVYSWHLDEKETEQTVIRAYGLDINNNSVCLKILNFQPFIYVELPIIKGLDWNQYTVGLVSRKIDDICGKFKPLEKHFVFKKKLYYANVEKNSKTGKYEYKMYPYLKLLFSTNEDIKKFTYKIKSPISIVTMGKINLRAHEQDANAVLQLTCVKKIPTCGWIEFLGKEQVEYDKETRCNREFIVNYNNMKSIDIRSVPEPLVMGFDIEVNSVNPNVMPKPNKPGNKIFQISCVFYKGGEYERYLLSLGEPDPETVGDDVEIRMFNNETTLLIGYTQLINEKNPNVIVGYNIFNFDLPYMIDRAKGYCQCISEFDKQGFLIGRNSKEKQISWTSGAYGKQEFKFLDAEGRLFVDLLPIVKRDYKFDSYTLKNVSTFFLGETKDPLSPKGIFKCYRVGMQGGEKGSKALGVCGKYVVQDAALTVKLFEKIDVWLGSTEMARICNVPIFYLYTQGQQIKVYSQIYLDCMYKDIIVEKDGYLVNEDDHYTGAKVFPPIPGAYDKVVPFDFTSLYPTTIIAHNIDYSTLVVDENIPDEDCHVIEWDEHTGCKHDTEVRKTKPKAIVCSHYKFRFLKEPMGVMPTKLKYLLEARDNTKKKMKEVKDQIKKCTDEKEKEDLKKFVSVLDKRQLAYKVSANSMYGAMGVKKGYLPFLPGAMCTTARGRQSIEKAAKTIQEEYGGKLVYGDTDSNYVHFPKIDTAQELWDYCIEVQEKISELFPKPMKMLFEEKIYWRFFILTKKRYMGLTCGRDGILSDKIDKKGVLLARRDNSAFIRKLYEKVMMGIFNRQDKNTVINMIIDELNLMFTNHYPIKDFIITKSVGDIDSYKIRELPTDPKKLEKRLLEMGLDPELKKMPSSNPQFKNRFEEEYMLKSLPSQVQLAEKLRRRGMRIDVGTRLPYVIIHTGNLKAKLADKLEDPEYVKEHSDIIRIDYLYYLKLLINPLDQALEVAYNIKKFTDNQYKLRLQKYKIAIDTFSSKINFIE